VGGDQQQFPVRLDERAYQACPRLDAALLQDLTEALGFGQPADVERRPDARDPREPGIRSDPSQRGHFRAMPREIAAQDGLVDVDQAGGGLRHKISVGPAAGSHQGITARGMVSSSC
jgi:hypothetical protein